MKVLILYSFLIYYASASPTISSQAWASSRSIKSLPAVNALIMRLEQERWEPDDETCLRTTLDMLRGVKNNTLWATWVWDSMQPPVGMFYGSRFHMGNYDQCLQAPWAASHPGLRTQYCVADVRSDAGEEAKEFQPFDSAEEYIYTPTKDARYFNEQSFGVCLPAGCSPSSVTKISRHMLLLTHIPEGAVYVDPRDCETAGELVKYPMGYYVFWIVVGVLFATAVFSTVCNNNETTETLDTIKKSFCMKRNYKALFQVSRDEIKVMNGMRFLTALVIVALHEAFYTFLCPVVNGLELDKIMSSSMGQSLLHAEVVVDTFFAMSGLLLVRGLVLGKQKNVLYTLVKRYIRLIGPYAICTLYLTTTVMYMDRGPFWRRTNRDEVEFCEQNWWKNLLMINNNLETMCHVVSWYVSVDFQLAIIATFLFWIFRRNRRLGVIVFVGVALGLTFNLGWTVYWKKLSILPFSLKAFFELRRYTVLNYTYLGTCGRAGAYLVGMAMGFLVTTYRPADHRNVITKKWSIAIACVSLATMSAVLCIGAIFSGRPYDPLEAAVAVATNRVCWAIAVCAIIGVCEYGTVPLITELLSWPGFVPLSKLSYGLYMLHPFILQKQKFPAKSAMTYGMYNMVNLTLFITAFPLLGLGRFNIVNSYGVAVVGCSASFFLYLILEAPLMNISHTLFTEKPKPLEENGIKKEVSGNGESLHKNGLNGHAKTKIL